MNTNQPIVRGSRAFSAAMTLAVMLALPSMARAEFLGFGAEILPFCTLGYSGGATWAQVSSVQGIEQIVAKYYATVVRDGNGDGRVALRQVLSLTVLGYDGTELWRKRQFGIQSEDVIERTRVFAGLVTPPWPDRPARELGYVGHGAECFGYGAISARGSRYVVVSMGVSAADGTRESFTDRSKINIWVLDGDTGTQVALFQLRPRPNRLLLWPTIFFGDVDEDGDAELVLSYSTPQAAGQFVLFWEVYDPIDKTLEARYTTTPAAVFRDENLAQLNE